MRHYRRVKEGLALLLVSFSIAFFAINSFLGSDLATWTVTAWMIIGIATAVVWAIFITVFPYVENPPKCDDQDHLLF